MEGEFSLIARLLARLPPSSPRVLVGPGDDGAVAAPPVQGLVATVDMQVEGVHFRCEWTSPEALGARILTVNLSDLAAMGAVPRYALVSLGLRDGVEASWLERVYDGLGAQARRFGVDILGGNVARVPERLVFDVTALGEGAGKTRAAARPGHGIYVTGPLGGAAGGLKVLERLGPEGAKPYGALLQAYLAPEPRVEWGCRLGAEADVGAVIDISDGLSSELHHLAEASGVGMALERVPLHGDCGEAARALGQDPLPWGLHGGEDYELLFTAPPEVVARLGFGQRVGTVLGVPGVTFEGKPLPRGGWDHLESGSR